jgi:nitric oxide reductase NorE protein
MSITLPTTCVDGTCAEQQTLGQAQRRRVPGETGVWLFIFGDMMVFAACFIVFLVARSADPMLFEQSRNNAKVAFGAINTLLLLTGSWFVVRGVRAIHSGRQDLSPKLFAAAMACGAVFGVNKFIEWGDKLSAGHSPAENDYFMYFFIFTGLHFAHLVVGMVVLGFMLRAVRRPVLTKRHVRNIESGGTYWHLVDLLWVVLFALLYLV